MGGNPSRLNAGSGWGPRKRHVSEDPQMVPEAPRGLPKPACANAGTTTTRGSRAGQSDAARQSAAAGSLSLPAPATHPPRAAGGFPPRPRVGASGQVTPARFTGGPNYMRPMTRRPDDSSEQNRREPRADERRRPTDPEPNDRHTPNPDPQTPETPTPDKHSQRTDTLRMSSQTSRQPHPLPIAIVPLSPGVPFRTGPQCLPG